MAAKFFVVTNVCSANKYLPAPLEVGEIVTKVKDEKLNEKRFIKVIHNEGKKTSIFSVHEFKPYTPKDKNELKTLLLKKGLKPTK